MEKQVYGSFDLGHGLHIALDPDHYEALIPNGFVVQTSLGKLMPPKDKAMDIWELKWEYLKDRAHAIVKQLNAGKMTEVEAIREIESINEDTIQNTLTI